MITRRDLVAAAVAAGITLACVSLADEPAKLLDSTAWNWADFTARKTNVGELRSVVDQPTRTLDKLEMHITTLNPHTASHPPHTHPNEEMVIVREGTLQAHVNGKEVVVKAGGVLFYASMQPHAVQNIGDTPATYYVINWATPASAAAANKKIPETPAPETAK
jgi:quercetin dioxygenase-like cupin family protein